MSSSSFPKFLETLENLPFLKGKESQIKSENVWEYPNYSPYTNEQSEAVNRSYRFSVNINKEFKRTVKENEERILIALNKRNYRDIPIEIQKLLSKYRKYLYNAYLLIPQREESKKASDQYEKVMNDLRETKDELELIIKEKGERKEIKIALFDGFYDLNHIDLMVKDESDSINIYEKTKKFLYTLYYGYNIKPREIERSLARGTLPTDVEFQIIQYTSESGKIGESIKNIRECRKINKDYKYETLKEKGWIYEDLPDDLEHYYGTQKSEQSLFPSFLQTLSENSFKKKEESNPKRFQDSWIGFNLEDLKEMSGIGDKTIERLRKNYNSLEEIYYESKNSPSDLAEKIYGISKEKAKKVWEFISLGNLSHKELVKRFRKIPNVFVDRQTEKDNYLHYKDESLYLRIYVEEADKLLDVYPLTDPLHLEFISYYAEKPKVVKAWEESDERGMEMLKEIYERDCRNVLKSLPDGEYCISIPDGALLDNEEWIKKKGEIYLKNLKN
jgi:hypothetical protein